MTKKEFLNKYNISEEEFNKVLRFSQSNEYGTEDMRFHLNNNLLISVEYDRETETIKNIYELL